jgi:hypothetical protein
MLHREYLIGQTDDHSGTIDARGEQLTGAEVIQKPHSEEREGVEL